MAERKKRAIRLSVAVVLALVSVVSFALAAGSVAGADPPGNNGTVKIDGIDFDDHPNNEPHPGCVFQIDFYGYDEGDLTARYQIQLWPPTGNREVLLSGQVDIGEDAAGGGTDLDASVTLDPTTALADSGVEPHPQQGFHVKLTVHAEGSQGNDRKHKVFWIECIEVEPTETPTPTPTPTETPTEEPTVEPTEEPSVLPTQTVSEEPSPEPTTTVLGRTFRRPQEPEVLATTGLAAAALGTIALIGALLMLAGVRMRGLRTAEERRARR